MSRCISWVLAGCGFLLVPAPAALGQTPRTTRVSVATDGVQANAQSASHAPSADGRYIAFGSSATNLVTDDTNGALDVFVHDRWTGATTRVSLAPGGVEADGGSGIPSLSADGRYVAFLSSASNLVADDTNELVDVFVLDRHTATTTRVSVSTGGGEANGIAYLSTISGDGYYVAFTSAASNLVTGDTNERTDVFLHDRQSATTTRVSVATGGGQANDSSYHCALSADGRYVAFESAASNLVADDTNQERDIFVHDRQTGTTTRVSVATGGVQANGGSYSLAFSPDARYVAFGSDADNLVVADTNGHSDVFLHDRQTATTTRVSVATGGEQANGEVGGPALSADGRYVAFTSSATNLVPGDTNATWDVFVHDRQTGNTTRISVATSGAQASGGNNGSYFGAFAAGGRYVAFISEASNLVPSDTNGAADVFVHDRGSWPGDFDGDRVSDATVFRPLSGTWYQLRSSGGAYGVGWGLKGDTPVPADYDGDGTTDLGVFRGGTWFLVLSANRSFVAIAWGQAGDMPVPADYDGDGKADVAVYRAGTWYLGRSSTHVPVGIRWGEATDTPVPADYDGDGRADVAVFRPSAGTWYIVGSATNTPVGVPWGQAGDVPVPADYDGDGKTDPTLFRTGTWYQLRSTTGAVGFGWGQAGDLPVVGDYDGDGRADPTVFRAGTWYELRSTTGAVGFAWGEPGDLPR